MGFFDDIASLTTQELLDDLVSCASGGWVRPGLFHAFLEAPPDEQRRALDRTLDGAVRVAVARGWCPVDVAEIARRRSAESVQPRVLEALARQAAEHPQTRVHPRWTAQLEQLRRSAPATPPLWPELVKAGIRLAATLRTLPTEPCVIPAPGSADPTSERVGSVDETALRRVRGLLAKAESTEFPAEAEALTAKAHRLMREHAIDRAMADSQSSGPAPTSACRIWLDNPYLRAKSHLVSEVAQANRCRSVFRPGLGVATVVGFGDDLDTVELLVTSLLLQAGRSMRQAGSGNADGAARSRTFRQSFLLSYARRIGERLREASSTVESESDARYDGALLPVLADRTQAVDDAFTTAFPHVRSSIARVGGSTGWGAGRAAADLARLDVRAELRSRAG
ncbi:DUF2786 domain-containing protein [Jatrophihabitans endophyticus]|uniref:DUF2786 domain-containing protein n=1 Tax=Jatrophihabitans endophyticus TaxID=1206085 RepID=UPI001A109F0A|nr:DUF2786 domain-containing protein [Jatrophihabitans endophyticus]MBE7187626.1 DUF2786 domain-containing protein [Jatrophihabitans endophyticus]